MQNVVFCRNSFKKCEHNEYRCIERIHILEGRLPLQCYSSKEKKDFNSDCCQTDFCNNGIMPQPGRNFF